MSIHLMMFLRRLALVTLAFLACAVPATADPSLGLSMDIVSEQASPGCFMLVQDKHAVPLCLDKADHPAVLRAASDLQADVNRVSGVKPELVTDNAPSSKTAVIVGTLGKSILIDGLVKSGKIKADAIAGKWESFIIATVAKPMAGVDEALVIAGSDRRGTIYGMYEISEQIGVSPWYWWADVPVKHHDSLFIQEGTYVQGPPAVKYRGIFINQENNAFSGWSRAKFGGVNSKMYAHLFELILRMRGNYLWPAMWGKSFAGDDPCSPVVADAYGVVMGSSHHEPLLRAWVDWSRQRSQYGNVWNYQTNPEGLKKYWADSVESRKNYDNIYTLGMRGDGDTAMPDAGGPEANKNLLERIITDQRDIVGKVTRKSVDEVPQMWALFTEVQEYYDAGLKVPDSVTLLFCDDNVGNVRRVPTPAERNRVGGSGIYFHMDMAGGPITYRWMNTNPLPKLWEQMNLVHEYGANQIWVVNVGCLKPHEIPIEFFLRMGWDPNAVANEKVAAYQLRWAEREFGSEHAEEIADLAARYAKYNGWCKPEVIRPGTYSLVNYCEAERVSQAWNDVTARAQKLNEALPQDQRDAFYQFVLHPALACSTFVDMYIAAGRNALYARQGRASANAEAAKVRELYQKDRDLATYYNTKLAGGKWTSMMDRIHVGYTGWATPNRDSMPSVTDLTLPQTADFGISVQGSTEAWPGSETEAVLPTFDSLNPQRSYIEVFAKGTKPFEFKATADQAWITLKEEKAPNAGQDRRVWVDVDWSKTPVGDAKGIITVTGGAAPIAVKLTALKATPEQEQQAKGCFAGLTGTTAFLAADATGNVPVGNLRWQKIPDYGRGAAAMEVFPVTAGTIKAGDPAPRLEYPVYFAKAGTYDVELITGPTLNIMSSLALGIAVSIDDQPLQVVNVYTPATMKAEDFMGRNHTANVQNNARAMHFTQKVDAPGRHTFKVSMVDPTVVVQKIIVHDRALPSSFFGPPETKLNGK
jgi:hypothetical protein